MLCLGECSRGGDKQRRGGNGRNNPFHGKPPCGMPHCMAIFISVAAIMPQPMGSGKPRRASPSRVFRQAEHRRSAGSVTGCPVSMTGGMPRTEAACGKIRRSVRDSTGQTMLQQRHAPEGKIELLTAAVADALMQGLRSAGATGEMLSGSL